MRCPCPWCTMRRILRLRVGQCRSGLIVRTLRWLRCHLLSLHRAENDFYETCRDCGYWKSDR